MPPLGFAVSSKERAVAFPFDPFSMVDLSSDGLGYMTIFCFAMRLNWQTVAFSFDTLGKRKNKSTLVAKKNDAELFQPDLW